MNEASGRGWRPEDDVAYGQRLALHLLWKYRYLLLVVMILGGLAGATIALILPPVYTSSATILVEKAGAGGFNLPDLPYLSGTTAPLDTEMQILASRHLAQQVIDELGLHIEVIDKQVPDAALNRIRYFLGIPKSSPYTRQQQYSRVRFEDIDIDEDLLVPVKLLMRADEAGNWRIRSLSGTDRNDIWNACNSFKRDISVNFYYGRSIHHRVCNDSLGRPDRRISGLKRRNANDFLI